MKREVKNGNFIQKLQSILKNKEYSHIIDWKPKNTAIDIANAQKMEEEILPIYFRHSKFESFVRQLNIYGFKKVKSAESHRFTHPLLKSGHDFSSIRSIKNSKQRENNKIYNNEAPERANQPLEHSVVEQASRKINGSGVYTLTSQQKNTIFLQKDLNQNQFVQWQQPNFPQIMFIPANQYLMWNFMSGQNTCNSSNMPNGETISP